MKANRKFVKGEEAVSAVIGVILMVAITVAIAATVYVYVSGMIGGGIASTPNVSMTSEPSGTSCVISIATPTKNDIDWGDVSFVLADITAAAEVANDGVDVTITTPADGTMVAGGQLVSIVQGSGALELQDGHQYRFTLTYVPTGGSMGTCTWTQ